MLINQAIAPVGQLLTENQVCNTLFQALEKKFSNRRVLVLIPDHTRSLPLPFLFRTLSEILYDAQKLDFLVALGTHPPLTYESKNQLVGITSIERTTTFKNIGLLNHDWNDPNELTQIGIIEQDQINQIAGERWHPSLPDRVEIRINKAALEYDHIIILGPTFPHEVVGFSGGAKYLFPGISGAEMINATHWLGALSGVMGTIGFKDTPVREMINAAAAKLTTPVTLVALVVDNHDLSGIFIGDLLTAWNAAAELSAKRHVCWCEKPFQRVLSCPSHIYDELWTAAKAMYKIEPVVEVGGEVIIYAPSLDQVSQVHGKYIYETGYHILPYFLANWDQFKYIPLGALAHSTHLRGSGVMENGIEKANVKVTLASKISAEDCAKLNLGYLNPAEVNISDWQDRESEGILYVPNAGERLFRVKT